MKQLLIIQAKTYTCKMQNAKVCYLLNYEKLKFYETKIDWILYYRFSIIYNFKFLHIIIFASKYNSNIKKKLYRKTYQYYENWGIVEEFLN